MAHFYMPREYRDSWIASKDIYADYVQGLKHLEIDRYMAIMQRVYESYANKGY